MLRIVIPAVELYDNVANEFSTTREQTLQLEHSLVSLSKWESKWQKPFLSRSERTFEETIDYIRCMTITQNVDPTVYFHIPPDVIALVNRYIDAPMTATTFSDDGHKSPGREIITAEIIYYWMIEANIPFECQKWHLNRLLTLIKVCDRKRQPPKKRPMREMVSKRAALNAARKKKYNTRG